MAKGNRTNHPSIKIHGHAVKGRTSKEYWVWSAMIQRCHNPKNKSYHGYGARGVKVCERWMNFKNFITDMGLRPSSKHVLDRKNGDGDYCPENCRWATTKQSGRNTRKNTIISFLGETMCVAEWAERLGWHPNILHDRFRLGWSIEQALTTPIRRHPLSAVKTPVAALIMKAL